MSNLTGDSHDKNPDHYATNTGEDDPAVGDILRLNREAQGKTLHDISGSLRISVRQLKALEESQWHLLPGRVYIIGFVRSYAEHLGADADQIVGLLKMQLDGFSRLRPKLNFPAPPPENHAPGWGTVIIAMSLIFITIFIWEAYKPAKKNPHYDFLAQRVDYELEGEIDLASIVIDSPEKPIESKDKIALTTKSEKQSTEGTIQEFIHRLINKNTAISPSSSPSEILTSEDKDTVLSTNSSENESSETENTNSVELALIDDLDKSVDNDDKVLKELRDKAPNNSDLTIQPSSAPVGTANLTIKNQDLPKSVDNIVSNPEEKHSKELNKKEKSKSLNKLSSAAGETRQISSSELPIQNETKDETVVLISQIDSWIEITRQNGEEVFARILRKGDQYIVPKDKGNLNLSTGNAGAIAIKVGGDELGTLGARGKVLRDVGLNARDLRRKLKE